MEKTKILLFSDLHLGLERVNPLITGEERLSTFRRIISLAHKHDILLIAGDLIHDENIASSYYGILKEEFSSLIDSGIEIFYTPGPGELTSEQKLNPEIDDIATTYTFSDKKDDSMIKSSKGKIFIYGRQSHSAGNGRELTRKEKTGFHIGLFHADFNPQIAGAPDNGCIKKDDIRKMNLDFYALGKNHTFKMFRFSNRILGAYAGSSEPCSIDETGDRYIISMEVENSLLLNIKRIAVNTGKILSDEIDCSAIINQNSLFDRIRSTYPVNSIVNLMLTGERDFIIDTSIRNGLAEIFRGLKITDMTFPSLKIMIDENMNSGTLKGEFFRVLANKLNSAADDKIKSDLLAGLITENITLGKSEGTILCNF